MRWHAHAKRKPPLAPVKEKQKTKDSLLNIHLKGIKMLWINQKGKKEVSRILALTKN